MLYLHRTMRWGDVALQGGEGTLYHFRRWVQYPPFWDTKLPKQLISFLSISIVLKRVQDNILIASNLLENLYKKTKKWMVTIS